ncbi:hypothetical protein B296_00003250 [Ensete ventricosum]|uniref:Uncharacterized protein n=1 Tax=Ensete ventricosum TaxID=4639 RepID=A0A427AG23_ENSVE|nr:hypothetical protein B296_00003250 [Ensete ventricosum]
MHPARAGELPVNYPSSSLPIVVKQQISVTILLAELTRLPALTVGVNFCNALPLPALAAASSLDAAINPCSNDYSRRSQSLPSPSDTIFPVAAASSPSSSRNHSPPPQHRYCTLLQPSSSDPFSRRLFLFRGSFSRKLLSTLE